MSPWVGKAMDRKATFTGPAVFGEKDDLSPVAHIEFSLPKKLPKNCTMSSIEDLKHGQKA